MDSTYITHREKKKSKGERERKGKKREREREREKEQQFQYAIPIFFSAQTLSSFSSILLYIPSSPYSTQL
jgi:hypothetical protein